VLEEFRKFIMRGNVIDLAVAVIIGASFGLIITSLVDDIIMPVVGVLMGGVDFSGLSLTVGSATIAYGAFIQTVINFLIIALALFVIIKAMNKASSLRQKKEAATPPPAPSEDIVLLTEIRDLLSKR
jgi:large conductance mechanosensitive channel